MIDISPDTDTRIAPMELGILDERTATLTRGVERLSVRLDERTERLSDRLDEKTERLSDKIDAIDTATAGIKGMLIGIAIAIPVSFFLLLLILASPVPHT